MVQVVLNVYDLIPQNDYLFRLGLGAYHSGVEISGVEYSFGGDPNIDTTGVFEMEPMMLKHRVSFLAGETAMHDVYRVLGELRNEFKARDYNLLS